MGNGQCRHLLKTSLRFSCVMTECFAFVLTYQPTYIFIGSLTISNEDVFYWAIGATRASTVMSIALKGCDDRYDH